MFQSPLLSKLQQHLEFHDVYHQDADAAVLVAITDELEPKILLSKRAGHLRQHAGEVSFVGGKRDAEDANDIHVALREAFEEIALLPEQVQLLGELPIQRSKSGLRVRPIVAVIDKDLPLTLQADEIEHIFYLPLQQFIQDTPQPYTVHFLNQNWIFPSIHFIENVNGEPRLSIVWGLTATILNVLLKKGLQQHKEWFDFYRQD
ncbi:MULTISPECIES: NUDIX hydrolase [unclassified Acinetobacter]|uniref:NUDIX hydrolase n=1 Tax=unclassified Acinetobacter TaxID=196816 RepID=UPI0035BA04B3